MVGCAYQKSRKINIKVGATMAMTKEYIYDDYSDKWLEDLGDTLNYCRELGYVSPESARRFVESNCSEWLEFLNDFGKRKQYKMLEVGFWLGY